MAAYYAGFHKKLKDGNTALEDRIKLARFGWVSSHCFLPNKHQVLLDWISSTLISMERSRVSSSEERRLWLLLRDALRSHVMQALHAEGRPVSLRANLCTAVLSALDQEEVSDVVVSCCDAMLTNERLRFIQNTKFESFVALTHKTLQLAVRECSREAPSLGEKHGTVLRLCSKCLAKCATLFQQQQNGKKACQLLWDQLLISCLKLHGILSTRHQGNAEDCGSAASLSAVTNFFRSVFFLRDMAEAYWACLLEGEAQKQKRDGRMWTDTVGKFLQFIESEMTDASLIAGLPVLYSAFLSSIRSGPELTFAMLKKLCCFLAAEGDIEVTAGQEPVWSLRLVARDQLLRLAADNHCYAVTEEEATRTAKLEWFKQQFHSLMSNKRRHRAWYRCLHTLLTLDHTIIAPRLQGVWPCLLATTVRSESGKSVAGECGDGVALAEARDALLQTILETFSKMRQLDKLINSLLLSILNKEEFTLSIALPASFHLGFGSAVESLTPASTVALWEAILGDVTTNHLPALQPQSTDQPQGPTPRKRRKRADEVRGHEEGAGALARFEVVATLLHCFLLHARAVDAADTQRLRDPTLALMGKMADDVLKPLITLCCHGNKGLLYPSTLLCHGWGEMELLLRQHTGLLDRQPLPELSTPVQNGSIHYLHRYMESSDWRKVMAALGSCDNGKLQVIQCLLLWQQARALCLHGDLKKDATSGSMMACVKAALKLASTAGSSRGMNHWDGLIGSVRPSNVDTAILSTTLHHAAVVLPTRSDQSLLTISRLVCQALVLHPGGDPPQEGMTGRAAAMAFLGSEACTESRPMLERLLKVVGERLNQLINIKEFSSKTSSSDFSSDIRSKLRCLMMGSPAKRPLLLEQREEEQLVMEGSRTLEVLQHLPLARLSPGNQLQGMLVLALFDLFASRLLMGRGVAVPTHSGGLLPLSTGVRRVLVTLLRGTPSGAMVGDEDLGRWFSSFLQQSCQVLLQMESEVALATDYMDAAGILTTVWARKLAHQEQSCEGLEQYLSQIQLLITAGQQRSSAQCPGVSALLSMCASLLHQCLMPGKHKESVKDEKIRELASSVKTSLFELLESCLASCAFCGNQYQVQNIMKAARTLLIGEHAVPTSRRTKSRRSIPNTHADSHGDGSHGDGKQTDEGGGACETVPPASLAGPGKDREWTAHRRQFTSCHKRALLLCESALDGEEVLDSVLASCLEYVATYCTAVQDSSVAQEVWQRLHQGLSVCRAKGYTLARQQLEGLLLISLSLMTRQELHTVLEEMLSCLKKDTDSMHLTAVLEAWQLFPMATLSEECYVELAEIAPKVMKCCSKILCKTVHKQPLEGSLTAVILTTASTFIHQGKDLLSAEHALPMMHLCLDVPLSALESASFPSCFTAVFQILNSLLLCYPASVLTAIPAFLSCVNYLMSAFIDRCGHVVGQAGHVTEAPLVMCSEKLQRLLSLTASLKADVSHYGIYLIADYISGLQRATLPPQVKTPLLEGIYKVVDVCDEKSLTLLNATLPVNLRELFKSFYSDYKKHHKYTGHV